MNQVQILHNHFSYKKKKVSFDDNVKKHDGASKFNSCFARLCLMYFRPSLYIGSIDNSFEILNFIYMNELDSDDNFILYCLNELELAKLKLLSEEEKCDDDDEQLSEKKNKDEDNDSYWSNEFWTIRSELMNRAKNQKKVCLTRKGNRELCVSIFQNHLNKLKVFIDMIKELIEWHDLYK
jgi:hypothetical protein